MRKLVSLVFVFSIAMLFVLVAPRAFAKPGSVKVDVQPTDCDDSNKETNQIFACDDAVLWVNVVSGKDLGTLTCTIICNDGSTLTCTIGDLLDSCDSASQSTNVKTQWELYELTYSDPATEGAVCTITVSGDFASVNNDVIGSDTWQQVTTGCF